MKLFEKFGEMNSTTEINELADNLLNENDVESIKILAKENGIGEEYVELFLAMEIYELCDQETAALGKIEVEEADLKPKEIMIDWIDYLKCEVTEDPELAIAVRKKGKSLKGMIGHLLKWSFGHQQQIDKEIIKAAGVNAGKVTLGIPGAANVKRLIREYYLQ